MSLLQNIKSWFQDKLMGTDEYRIVRISLDKITSNPFQPRSEIADDSLDELAQSIEEYDVITPIIVTPTDEGQYQLVAGERRVRASKELGKDKIPAVVREYTDEELIEVSFLENLQREPMSAVDKAKMYKRLRTEFKNLTVEELSQLIGKPREEITRRDWILDLPLITRRAIANGVLDLTWAKLLQEVDEEHHREIILFITQEAPEPGDILQKIREFNPDVSLPDSETIKDLGMEELPPGVNDMVKGFGRTLEDLYENGEPDESENSPAETDEDIPEELSDRD